MKLPGHEISRTRRIIAFTLIELLVVIAIVAILSSLLLPVLSRSKALTSATKCKSNLHQMGTALAMYFLENDGAFPAQEANLPPWQSCLTRDLGVNDDYWLGAGSTVFQCPTHTPIRVQIAPDLYVVHPSYGYNVTGNPGYRTTSKVSLGLGGVYSNGFTETVWVRPTRESDLRNPAETIAIGDGYVAPALHGVEADAAEMTEHFILGRDIEHPFHMLGWSHDRKSVEKRHRGLLNMVICDGHVEEGKIKTWYFSEEERHARRWNIDNLK